MTTKSTSDKQLIAGIATTVIALIMLVTVLVSSSSEDLGVRIDENKTRITLNEESIHQLKTDNAVNQEQHKQIIEKLDKVIKNQEK